MAARVPAGLQPRIHIGRRAGTHELRFTHPCGHSAKTSNAYAPFDQPIIGLPRFSFSFFSSVICVFGSLLLVLPLFLGGHHEAREKENIAEYSQRLPLASRCEWQPVLQGSQKS